MNIGVRLHVARYDDSILPEEKKRPFKQRAFQYATLINIVAAGRGIFSGTRTRVS